MGEGTSYSLLYSRCPCEPDTVFDTDQVGKAQSTQNGFTALNNNKKNILFFYI